MYFAASFILQSNFPEKPVNGISHPGNICFCSWESSEMFPGCLFISSMVFRSQPEEHRKIRETARQVLHSTLYFTFSRKNGTLLFTAPCSR